MRNILLVISFVLWAVSTSALSSTNFKPMKGLLERRVPWLAGKVTFRSIPAENGYDVFEITTRGQRLEVSASSVPAAGQAINWYLKYYCRQLPAHNSDNVNALPQLPRITQKERHVSRARYRFANGYCTFNYSMSFYTWEEWEKELDWMALNGVNLSLAIVGTEEVWYNVLKQLSFPEKDILSFIPGPAFTSWWLMANLEGWGGPLTHGMIKQNTVLQQRILARMEELGIAPELNGFYGMVPTSLKRLYPQAQIVDQGKWAGGFTRPAILLPTDTLFDRIAALYYGEIRKLYGSNIRFFGGDPFHEGGSANGIDISTIGSRIQQSMQQHFPTSTWVLQGWGDNPQPALLSRLDKRYTLVQDLRGENRAEWDRRKGFEQTPFLWCVVSNFGGKEGLYGRLNRMLKEPCRAAVTYPDLFSGVGTMPEGNLDNPVVYDLIYSWPWMNDSMSIGMFIEQYPVYRYGAENKDARAAWDILLHTVYTSTAASQEGAPESFFCARPSFNISSVSTWGTRRIDYDTALLEKGARLLMMAGARFEKVRAYRFDLVDVVRQVIANKGQYFHQQMKTTFAAKNIAGFERASRSFLDLLLMQDSLLQCDERFMLSTWIGQARKQGADTYAKNLNERNARWLVTLWGPPDNPATDLHEYSHREWNGLLSSLYYQRWKAFVDHHTALLAGKPGAVPDYYQMEKNWANQLRYQDTRELQDYLPVAGRLLERVLTMK